MHSRLEQVSGQRARDMGRRLRRSAPHATSVIAMIVLLVGGSLISAAGAGPAAADRSGILTTLARMGQPTSGQEHLAASLQDTPQPPGEPQEPPTGATTGTPATPQIETETPEPPEGSTEPALTETTEPPPGTAEPAPSETSGAEATPEETPESEETEAATATVPVAATESPTVVATSTDAPTATAADSVWGDGWPLGTIEFGAGEPGPPSEPVQIAAQEWLQLALALVVVALVAILGGRLLYRLLRLALRRRHLEVDGTLLAQLKPLLSWWLAAIGFHIAVVWIGFENRAATDLFEDLVFFAYLGVATLTTWRFADSAVDLYANRIAAEGQTATIERLRPILRRWARILVLIVSALLALGRVDLGFSAPTVLVLFLILSIALAARDTIQDVVAGFTILIDQPFRIGDLVEVQGVGTWAAVVNIGLRSSVLRTRHNVEITVPNSTIGKGQVINYSYPDSRYRMQTQVGIAFGTNVERARRVMIDAVRQTEFVLADEPVDALYMEIGDSDMIFRVRWWIDFYSDWERAYDSAHTALHNALDEAGIESPYPSQNLDLEVDDQTLAEVWEAWQGEGAAPLAE